MKHYYILILLISIVFAACKNPASDSPVDSDSADEINIDDLKGLINYVPTVISLDPTHINTTSGIARGLGSADLSGGFDFEELTGLLVGYSELISAGIKEVKSELELVETLELNKAIAVNRKMSMSDSVPGTTTLNKYKYNLSETELTLWLNSTLDLGINEPKLDIDCKISISASDYSAKVSFYEYNVNLEDEYDAANYDYWVLDYDHAADEISVIEVTADQVEFYTKKTNNDGKYDFFYDRNNIPPLTDPDAISVIMCRDSGVYATEYHDDTIDAIAIFNTDLSLAGRDLGSTPITYGSETDINISNYQTYWPSDYATLRNAHSALLVTKESEIRNSISAGTFFPHSEFSDL